MTVTTAPPLDPAAGTRGPAHPPHERPPSQVGALGDPRRQRRAQPRRLRVLAAVAGETGLNIAGTAVVAALLYLAAHHHHLGRRRGAPQGRRPPRHRRRRRRVPHRDGAARLGGVDRRRQRRRGPVGRVLHELDAQRRRRGRRRAPRHRRHAPHHPRRGRHLDPDRAVHRDLPRRVRPGPQARARHHVPRRRHDRHPVDRRRSVRVRRCSRSSSAPASAWASWVRSRWPC